MRGKRKEWGGIVGGRGEKMKGSRRKGAEERGPLRVAL